MKEILFACTGNTCRSPMAQALFTAILKERGLEGRFSSKSAGLSVVPGSQLSANSALALAEVGLALPGFIPTQLTPAMVAQADTVLVMTGQHRAVLAAALPEQAQKIQVLGEGIPDPYGGDLAAYRRCRDAIRKALEEWLEREAVC